MLIKQISIFVENRFGAVSDIIELLSENDINICALSIADTSDYGIMRLIVNDCDKAKNVLNSQGVIVSVNEVLALPIKDEPGGLSYVLKVLKNADISIDYMYAFVGRSKNNAIVVAKTDNMEKSISALKNVNIIPLCKKGLF